MNICRGLILLHPVSNTPFWRTLKGIITPSGTVRCQQGVIELDPYNWFRPN